MSKDMKPKKQLKTALLICALTSMTPVFGESSEAIANSSTPPQ